MVAILTPPVSRSAAPLGRKFGAARATGRLGGWRGLLQSRRDTSMAVAYKDYYKILGVEKNADAKAIKQAYRRLARKYHPDMNPGNKSAAERFKEINEANEVLSDPEKRRRYDALGPDWRRYVEGGPGGGAGGPDFGDFRVHVEPGADLGDFSEFFRTLFGDLGRRQTGGPPGRPRPPVAGPLHEGARVR